MLALIVGLTAIVYGGGLLAARADGSTGGPAEIVHPAAAAASAAGPDADPRTLTVLGAGDILVHPEIWQQARADGTGGFDFRPLFAGVKGAVSAADLAICHLETPLAAADGPFLGFPTFSAPPQVLDGVKAAGFDACSTASNHSLDHGAAGVTRTLQALDRAGLAHTGTYRNAAAAATPTLYRVRGVTVAHLSYTAHFNGIRPPPGKAWLANRIDPDAIRAMARQARRAGAQIVLLSLHWGTEYRHEPDAAQLDWARQLIGADEIDAILGHHAHVVQPFERVDGEWVVYGMGNQLARHAQPLDANREGVMARLTFTRGADGRWRTSRAEAVVTWVELQPDIRLVDVAERLADPALSPARRATYQAVLERVRGHVLSRGAGRSGLVVTTPPR